MRATPGAASLRGWRGLPLALACAVASAPAIVGLALATSTAAIDNVSWAAAAAYVSAATLRRATSLVPLAAGLVLVVCLRPCWDLAHAMSAPRAFPALGTYSGNVSIDAPADEWWRLIVSGTAIVSFVAGVGLSRASAVFCSVVFVATAQVTWLGSPATDVRSALHLSHFGLLAGSVVTAHLGSRGRLRTAAVLIVVTASQYAYFRDIIDASTFAAALTLPLAYVAGAISRELRAGAVPDDAASLVVFVQRHPWTTSLALASPVVAATGTFIFSRRVPGSATLTLCALVLVVAAFVAHAGRGARTGFDRLAPWLAANVGAAATTAFIVWESPRSPVAVAIGVCAGFALWPLVTAAFVPGDPPGDTLPLASVAIPCAVAVAPFAAHAASPYYGTWGMTAAVCLLFVPVAFHTALRSTWGSSRIVLASLLVGIAWGVFEPKFDEEEQAARWALLHPAAWTFAAVLVIAARRARSMTAVPLDHPIVTDFGGA